MERNKLNKRSLFGVGFAGIVSAFGYQNEIHAHFGFGTSLFHTYLFETKTWGTCNIRHFQSNGLQAKHLICLFLTSISTSTHPCNEWDYRCFQTIESMRKEKEEENIVKYMIEDNELKIRFCFIIFTRDLHKIRYQPLSFVRTHTASKETFIFWFFKERKLTNKW